MVPDHRAGPSITSHPETHPGKGKSTAPTRVTTLEGAEASSAGFPQELKEKSRHLLLEEGHASRMS